MGEDKGKPPEQPPPKTAPIVVGPAKAINLTDRPAEAPPIGGNAAGTRVLLTGQGSKAKQK